MATQVKHRRGTQAEVDNFTGALGEIVVNTTEEELVLGNGATQGGIPVPRKDKTMLSFDTLADAVANTALKDGYSVNVTEYTSGNGGGAIWDVVPIGSGTVSRFFVACTGVPSLALKLRITGLIDPTVIGSIPDKSTDNTAIVIDAVIHAYDNAASVIIPEGTVWDFNELINFASGTVSANDPLTITGVDTQGKDMTGAFVWNLTDNSFGVVDTYTATSVTLKDLRLGTLNTFTAGDEYQISMAKVDVTIFDNSRYSTYTSNFTGQVKVFLNSDDPDFKSANEQWAWGQYHPGFISALHEPGNVSGRASWLARRYNANKKLQSTVQFGLNPVRPTDPVTQPGAAADVLMVVGHNEGDQAQSIQQTLIAMGIRCADDMNGQYIAFGTRAQDGITMYIVQPRNTQLVNTWNAAGIQRTKFQFENAGVEGRSLYHWGSLSGFSGYNSIVQPRTSSLTVDSDLYSDATFTNEGAGASVTISMESSAPVGYQQELVVDAAQNLVIQLLGGATFYNGDTTRRSNTPGDIIKVKKISSTRWAIINELGTWTV